MDVNWAIRPLGKEPPSYPPNSEYFTIKLQYTDGDVHKWADRSLAGFADYCCADKISRLELVDMAKEMGLIVDGCRFWWLDINNSTMGLREIINDADALAMAMTVNHTKVINLYAKVSSSDSGAVKVNVVRNKKAGNASTENVDKIIEKDQLGNVEESEAGNVEGGNATDEEADDDKELEEGSELHDSEYSFNSQEEGEEEGVIADSGSVPMHIPVVDAKSDYASSDDLNSCFSTDEEQLEPNKPKYAEFTQDCDMKDPHFKIGMKFSSFKQFREAVRNYGASLPSSRPCPGRHFPPPPPSRLRTQLSSRLPDPSGCRFPSPLPEACLPPSASSLVRAALPSPPPAPSKPPFPSPTPGPVPVAVSLSRSRPRPGRHFPPVLLAPVPTAASSSAPGPAQVLASLPCFLPPLY
ncbi:protein diaphanous homolog 1-like [Dioscorea cayenensis subsp. rotundata]|uniref:Protein diaphanous homolog 1-like n=1 Tax=Dioscorea cayennensis subsp. rotundata TaxID=55577 RepID=A0AB40C0C4_DIOCR|nr:protein diaphanous homolog 1-like [Dioscorea cayenensis subsp. rotundata]